MLGLFNKLVGNTAKYPYLVGVGTAMGFGSGILIGSRLVLTCKHLLDGSDTAEVILTAGAKNAVIKKVDDSADLALLELAEPISAPRPQFADGPLHSRAILLAVGVQETPGRPDQLTVAEVQLKYRNKNDAGGRILDIQFEGGVRPGYSGGPIVLKYRGSSFCVGVTRLGGNWSLTSNAIGLAHIRAFASDHISEPDNVQEATQRIEKATTSNAASINLSNLALTAIPDLLLHLRGVRELDLSHNQISTVPDSLAQLAGLTLLDLSHNQINSIPDWLAQSLDLQMLGLTSELQYLDLSYNEITALPESLTSIQFTDLKALFLHGNPGLGIPDEILGPGLSDISRVKHLVSPMEIFAYYKSLSDAKALNEAKLIMIGPGAVGKTSLVKALTTGKFNRWEKTTDGIKISDWECPISRDIKIRIHIWDFGGQEIMHATHQFFLTARTLYILVLNRRQGGCDREADYWFRLIRSFGGQSAQVIVVLNRQKSEPFDVNRGGWLEKYAGNIEDFVETDCTDRKSITELKRKIQRQLRKLKGLHAKWPLRWFAIKDELSHMPYNYITFDDYRAICHKHGEHDPTEQTRMADLLHDLGIALNYKDDPRLRFAYVLKPEWVTQGIYSLLHSFVQTKGVFSYADAEGQLRAQGYPSEAAHFILGLMEQFELCFPLGDKQKRILIPQLLGDQQPEMASTFKPEDCLNFGYQYTVITEGLLPRLIVRTHHLSKPETRWKTGAILAPKWMPSLSASGCSGKPGPYPH